MRIYVLILAAIALAVAFTGALLFAPALLPEYLRQPSDRIGLGQLVISGASLLALLLAALEFRRGQLRPRLSLWLQPWLGDEPNGEPTQTYVDRREYSSESGCGKVYSFSFKLMVENYGEVSARWVKVSIELRDPRPPVPRLVIPQSELQRLSLEQPSGRWIPAEGGSKAKRHIFHGGDDFVVYSRPKKVDTLYSWLEDIGQFELKVPVAEREENQKPTVQLIYSIQADGFVSHNQLLQFRPG